MAAVVDSLSDDYLEQFDRDIAISGMSKAQQFQFIQDLAYNGILGFLVKDFHGLTDFYNEMQLYSSTNTILASAWNAIKLQVPLNQKITAKTYNDPNLGTVGILFQTIPSYAQAFSISSDTSSNSDDIDDSLSNV